MAELAAAKSSFAASSGSLVGPWIPSKAAGAEAAAAAAAWRSAVVALKAAAAAAAAFA